MYSINTFTKKKYITPVIEFEMMEEEGALMDGGMVPASFNHTKPGEQEGAPCAKRSDFIFDDDWTSEQSDISNENNGAW